MSQLTSRGYLPEPHASLNLRTCLLCVNMFVCIYTHLLLCTHVHNIITSYHSIFNNHFKNLEGSFDAGLRWTRRLPRGQRFSPLNKCHQRSSATTGIRGYDPLDMVSLILVEGNPLIRSSPIKDVDQSSTSNIFLCLPCEILENMNPHIVHHIMTGFSHTGLFIFLLFISVRWIWNKLWRIFKHKMLNSNKCSWLWLMGKRTWRLFF